MYRVSEAVSKWSESGQSKYNLEQIPGESLAVRLAEIDSVLGKNERHQVYSNQYVPLTVNNVKISDRYKIQGRFDSLTSGGSILHVNIDEANSLTPVQFKRLFDLALKTKTVYWAVNYVYVKCEQEHYFIGSNETKSCPACGSDRLDYYSRVVGFVTNVKDWIEKRREWEFGARKFYGSKEM
jgi:ribonucleoside-triphosphate reductase